MMHSCGPAFAQSTRAFRRRKAAPPDALCAGTAGAPRRKGPRATASDAMACPPQPHCLRATRAILSLATPRTARPSVLPSAPLTWHPSAPASTLLCTPHRASLGTGLRPSPRSQLRPSLRSPLHRAAQSPSASVSPSVDAAHSAPASLCPTRRSPCMRLCAALYAPAFIPLRLSLEASPCARLFAPLRHPSLRRKAPPRPKGNARCS